LGTAEIEDAFNTHDDVAETAIVGYEHPVKGEGIYAYCILKNGCEASAELERELVQLIRAKIGPIANPDFIQFTTGLPKTRSGKIMRRILRKIAQNDFDNLGDISTLSEPQVVENLIANRKNV
jgi:acetyl-CoA synthetase